MLDLCSPAVIRDIQARYGFSFSKALGQNFLINPTVCPRMAQACGGEEGGVLEIGPGIGVLTAQLALRAKKVVAVELDKRLIPVLEETLAEFPHVKVVQGDALKLDLQALIAREFSDMPVSVCANLPYYITTPLMLRFLAQADLPWRRLVFMVQKELAERIKAAPGSKDYGALSLAVQYRAQARLAFTVPPGVFLPRPKVASAVIVLERLAAPPVQPRDEALFFAVIRAGFNQRRKTLPNSLSSGLQLTKEQINAALIAAGIDSGRRAETLTIQEFARLADEIKTIQVY